MLATWKYTARRLLIGTLGWSIALWAAGMLMIISFDYVIQQNKDLLVQLMSSLPAVLQSLAGNPEDFATPKGFLDVKFFVQSGLMLGIYAVLTGSGLLAADEEQGRLDLLAAYPVSRRCLFWGRVAAMGSSFTVIVCCAWMGLAGSLWFTNLKLTAVELASGCLTLLALATVYGSLALLLSLLLPSRRVAAGCGGLLLFVSFLLALLSPAIDFLRPINAVLPFHYYQGGKAMHQLDLVSLGVLSALAGTQLLAAWWFFDRRDIRVKGESTWQLPRLALRVAVCLCVYALIVGPVVAVRGWSSNANRSPAEFLQSNDLPLNQLVPQPK